VGARHIGRPAGTSLASGRFLPRQSASKQEVSGYLRHLDAAPVLWTHSVKANVLRKQRFKAKVLRTQSVKAKGIQTRLTMTHHTLTTERSRR